MIDFNVQSHPCLLAIGGEDDLEVAGNLLRSILVREPAYPEAAALLRRIEEKAGRERGAEPPSWRPPIVGRSAWNSATCRCGACSTASPARAG